VRLALEYQPPYDWAAMLGFLAARAVVGMETVVDGVYSRSIGLNGVHGTVSVWLGAADALEVELDFPDPAAVPEIVVRLRRMFDLDAELALMHGHLANDPLLARLIAERPGLRIPGAWDGLELAFRAVLGQQITVVAAIRLAGKLVAQYGAPLESTVPGLTHVFPEAHVLAAADLAALGMPKSRGRTLSGVAQGVAGRTFIVRAESRGRRGTVTGVARDWRVDGAVHCVAAIARYGWVSPWRCRVVAGIGSVGGRAADSAGSGFAR
jgi:DNA-3-methyladenine glycosylase II